MRQKDIFPGGQSSLPIVRGPKNDIDGAKATSDEIYVGPKGMSEEEVVPHDSNRRGEWKALQIFEQGYLLR